MIPTPEQAAIVDAAYTTKDNIIISALAGAAKTTTLRLIAERIAGIPILSIAFNKRIAEEMAAKLPSHVKSATLNSVGHRIWMSATKPKLTLNVKKSGDILSAIIDKLDPRERREIDFVSIIRDVSRAKSLGYFPKEDGLWPGKTPLISKEDFLFTFEEEPDPFTVELVDSVLNESIKQAYDGVIDFDDQIFMPTLFGGSFPQFPLNLVDEAQDLSLLNHAFLRKLVGPRRLIAVGDRNQAIYAFRGAMTNSMDMLRQTFSMKEMTLSVSFRCPKAIVQLARQQVPSMEWAPNAAEGEIVTWPQRTDEGGGWTAEMIPADAAVICRNNAPLLRLALALLRAGRGVKLVGSDLGPQLIRTLKKLGDPAMPKASVLQAIAAWQAQRERKSRAKATLADKADCLRVFAEFGNNLGDAIAYAEHLFASTGTILLMSGHKAKGLEFNDVIFLNSDLIPSIWAEGPEELQQEENIRYVIITRSKQRLIFADLQDFHRG